MKVKEKLAKEKYPQIDGNGTHSYQQEAYIAGFERARSMAFDIWSDKENMNADDFLYLGEEEIQSALSSG